MNYVSKAHKDKYLTSHDLGYEMRFVRLEDIDYKIFEKDKIVGYDTEWRPEFRKGGQGEAAIIQLAFPNARECWVIDLLPENYASHFAHENLVADELAGEMKTAMSADPAI